MKLRGFVTMLLIMMSIIKIQDDLRQVNPDVDGDYLGVEATERSRGGGALDGGVDGDGGQIPV